MDWITMNVIVDAQGHESVFHLYAHLCNLRII